MFFRPSFCAHCGEKVERAEWRPWTSRRFCLVCESEFMGADLIPRVVVAVSVLAGVLGLNTYLRSGAASEIQASSRQPYRLVEKQAAAPPVNTVAEVPPLAENSTRTQPVEAVPVVPANTTVRQVPPELPKPKMVVAESTYYCGAETRKGTPCSRRVKGSIRCYQHVGMPAMVPADQLKFTNSN